MTANISKIIHEKLNDICIKINKHTFLAAVVVNAIALILVFIFCETKYETSDDYIMATVMAGAYDGNPNPYMIYINVLWGYFLLPFYHLLPQISWYLLSQLFLCFCSFTAVTYLLLKKMDTLMALMISILFITLFSNDAYLVVQFTKTAILAVMSGSVLFLDGLFYGNRQYKKEIFTGGLLVFAGSLIRYSVIYIAGGFLILILLIEITKIIVKKNWKKNYQVVVVGLVLLGTVVAANEFDQFIYNQNEEYRFFREYGDARGKIVDKRDNGFQACAEEFKKMGLTENDYKLLRTWNFADPDFFTLERMEKIQKIINDYQTEQGFDRDEVKYALRQRNFGAYPSLWGCIILVLLTIIFMKRYWIASLLAAGLGYLYFYYFAASGKIVYRVEYAVFVCIFLVTVFFWDKLHFRELENKLEMYNICVILLMLLCLYQVPKYRLNPWAKVITGEEYKNYIEDVFFDSWDFDSRRYRCSTFNTNGFSELQKEVEANPNNFYFLNFSTTIQTLYLSFNPLENEQKSIWKNSSYLAGVTINYPDVLNLLERENVENPIKSLLKDNVYLVDNFFQEEILIYIREHYYPNARKELYKTIDGFQIWKFYEN